MRRGRHVRERRAPPSRAESPAREVLRRPRLRDVPVHHGTRDVGEPGGRRPPQAVPRAVPRVALRDGFRIREAPMLPGGRRSLRAPVVREPPGGPPAGHRSHGDAPGRRVRGGDPARDSGPVARRGPRLGGPPGDRRGGPGRRPDSGRTLSPCPPGGGPPAGIINPHGDGTRPPRKTAESSYSTASYERATQSPGCPLSSVGKGIRMRRIFQGDKALIV